MTIGGCNMAMEAVNLIISGVFIILMLYTKPRNTFNFRLNLYGMIMCFAHIILHFVLVFTLTLEDSTRHAPLYVISIIYFVLYYLIIAVLFFYINQLSNSQRTTTNRLRVIRAIIFTFFGYMGVLCLLLFSGRMFTVTDTGAHLTPFFGLYLVGGAGCAISIFVLRIRHSQTIAKIMKNAIVLAVPADIILLVFQFIFHNVSFVGITYVIPFVLFYLLMHSSPYDELSGVQNRFSFEAQYISKKKGVEKCLIGIVYIPQLEMLNMGDIDYKIGSTIASVCCYMENITHDMRVYNIDKTTYAFITSVTKQSVMVHIESMLRELLSAPVTINGVQKHYDYKCIMFHDIKGISNYETFYDFADFIFEKIDSVSKSIGGHLKSRDCNRTPLFQDSSREYYKSLTYHATQKDYEDYTNSSMIENVLIDIYNKKDLDDPRVVCYVQPIYDVCTKSFRTGEALMRLCIDGKIIFPDQFIPIAEKNGYIHVLTCIILNKVCRKIYALNTKYSFDAISINCSTTEFMDPNLHDELLSIIYENHVPCSKIRLELTESASASNYETVLHNMEVLSKTGIKFYLDDFGTGYSNLSRILSLPFHTVKFDKSLLYKSIENEHIDHLFGSMAETFKNSGLLLLVEGVEDDTQSDYVIGYKFDYIQGYKYAKPQDIEKFAEYLTPIGEKSSG